MGIILESIKQQQLKENLPDIFPGERSVSASR